MSSPAYKMVGLLAASQALLLTNGITILAVTGLAGATLSSNKSLATLPMTTLVLGATLSTIPASLAMRSLGRRTGFTIGGSCGMAGAMLAVYALSASSFTLLCLATFLAGIYAAFGQFYRFAAADVADAYAPDFKARAISLVLAGGIVGGVLGPELSKITRDLLPTVFAGTYAMLAVCAAVSVVLIQLLDLPAPTQEEMHGPSRPLSEIMRQPVFIVALVGAMTAYGGMNFLMNATPLAMQICAYPYKDIAFILEWHVIGMFLPSFFTGSWIKRFGVLPVMAAGAVLMLLCIAVALTGVQLTQFWFALVLLGVGWNFLYIGSTTLLTTSYTPAEKAKVQGINDFLVSGILLVGSYSSGMLVLSHGWFHVNKLAIPFVALGGLAVAILAFRRRNAA